MGSQRRSEAEHSLSHLTLRSEHVCGGVIQVLRGNDRLQEDSVRGYLMRTDIVDRDLRTQSRGC